jgi:hypothetical protein
MFAGGDPPVASVLSEELEDLKRLGAATEEYVGTDEIQKLF